MKHRLVGMAVLVALGVIAWPVIFDTTPMREINQRSQIPPAPAVDRFGVDEPAAVALPPMPDNAAARAAAEPVPDLVPESTPAPRPALGPPVPVAGGASAAAPEQSRTARTEAAAAPVPPVAAPGKPAAAPAKPVPEPVAQPARDQFGLPEQWAVQLGVFGKQENAQELKARAERAGYHAILQISSANGARQYRVFVEPKLNRLDAQRVSANIEKSLGVKGYVTRYYP
jgi:DedD protein